MLEVVVLNPPRRGRSKKKMATKKRRRSRRKNPWYLQVSKNKWAEVSPEDLRSWEPGWKQALLSTGNLSMVPHGPKVQHISAAKVDQVVSRKVKALKKARKLEGYAQLGKDLVSGGSAAKKRKTTKRKASKKKARRKTTKRAKRSPKKSSKRKQMATKKKSRKKASRKKARRKKSTRKKATRKKATRKKATRKKARRKKARRKSSSSSSGYVRSSRRASRARRAKTLGRTRTVKLKAGSRLSTRRRKKLIAGGYLSKSGRVNPGRRRRRRRKAKAKNPRRGRRRRRRRNPGGKWMALGKALLKAGVGVVGASAIHGVSSQLVGMAVERLPVSGPVAKALRVGGAAATGFATVTLARWVEGKLGTRRWIGGALTGAAMFVSGAVLLKTLLEEFAPLGWAEYVPDMRTRALPIPGLSGMGDWVELRAGPAMSGMGMGDFVSPEMLVAGESYAQSINGMAGIGALPGGMSYPGQYGMGDYRLAMSNIRGMGDWIETVTPGAPLDPGAESF